MKYRKKPIVVEAFQWTGGPDQTEDPEWICEAIRRKRARFIYIGKQCHFLIVTPEGTMEASQGDYIIRGVNSEIYPCKPDIFEKTYDRVNEDGDEDGTP